MVPMRKLSALKVVSHALASVRDYRSVGLHLGLAWTGLLWLLGIAGLIADMVTPAEAPTGAVTIVITILSIAASLAAFSSIAVGWHRFILRDEIGSAFRLDRLVWIYAGNFLAVMILVVLPVLVLALLASSMVQAAALVAAPAVLYAEVFAMRLWVKLPAVALGRQDFGFREALAVSDGNFWPLLAVLLLNGAIVLGAVLVLNLAMMLFEPVNPVLAGVVVLSLGAAFQLFYILFYTGIFTALYGFFVEGRDF